MCTCWDGEYRPLAVGVTSVQLCTSLAGVVWMMMLYNLPFLTQLRDNFGDECKVCVCLCTF